MTTPTTTQRRRLTDAELDHVCDEARTHWTRAVVATFDLFGVDLTDADGPSISPADFQIPEDQWGIIAQACTRADEGSSLTMAGAMLDWMNYGPSTYTDDAS
jgi:hypothetical protein